ncbi:sugar ABC transporter substrate-binding protein [Alteromonas sp. 5E99-2]|uniref:ABC transporter substrate-binding protein n=1 Tax=Alteromonas sp. 5E99-2 TaxID=2817683 RepID=UPI001A98860A|nr:sugar ABC transporter substrate-binding protein [Alteromonas sp. 5E99-2]MBO1254673.1 sugar ABC transporter substrate-binding protein [Alteromonas sp. 5E99-2]
MKKTSAYIATFLSIWLSKPALSTELNIATVNNAHMIEMQKLTPEFEQEYPDIKLKWHVFNEGSLRMRAVADIASGGGNYDVVTIGLYETPIWAKRDWLIPLQLEKNYDVGDLLPAIRSGLSYKNDLYAAPFYGESSMLMYRKDLIKKAGVSFDSRPTWTEVKKVAEAIHDPTNGVYGICLRGKPGWGDNMALISTIANSFGGRWFDMSWQPEINSNVWNKAVNFYVDLLNQYGPPNPAQNSFPEILALSREGKCGMWVDASVAASFLTDPQQSKFANSWSYVEAPYQETTNGASWLWAWSLAIPKKAAHVDAAQTFINWATSKNYIQLVAANNGWENVPTGTRSSTYNTPAYVNTVGDFASAELAALNSADPNKNTLKPSPYSGVQFVPIPEFVSIAGFTGQQITKALEGEITVEQALDRAQKIATREMRRAGY